MYYYHKQTCIHRHSSCQIEHFLRITPEEDLKTTVLTCAWMKVRQEAYCH